MSRRHTPAKRCQFKAEVWGPHPGCREYMSAPAFIYRCTRPATHVVKIDTDPRFVAPTYPPRRRGHPPWQPWERARHRLHLCGDHAAEAASPRSRGRPRVYRFRTLTPTPRR